MPDKPPPDPALVPESLPTALLLAASAGLLDATTYLLHGRVFATAMTGNTVLLGIGLLSGNRLEFWRHLAPIAAFVAGVAASKVARDRLGSWAGVAGLLLEAATLGAAGLLPASFPDTLFTIAISCVAAIQVAGLRRVGPYSYNSTFVTGDLRDFMEGFYGWLNAPRGIAERDRQAKKARDLGLAWAAFLIGAALGAFSAPHLGNRTYWLPVPVLLGLAPIVLRNSRRFEQPSA